MTRVKAPLAEQLARTVRRGVTTFGLPAHGPGGHVDDRTRAALGLDVFRADAFSPKGVDDRIEGGGFVDAA